MQASSCGGLLASRLASHVAAACSMAMPSATGLTSWTQWRTASATAASSDNDQGGLDKALHPALTSEQRQQLPKLLSLLQRPGNVAQRLGVVTSLAVSYRDLSVALSALHMREHGLDPRVDDVGDYNAKQSLTAAAAGRNEDAAGAAKAAAPGASLPKRGTYLPLKDVTAQPDNLHVDGKSLAPEEPQYLAQHMDKISCWAALQPSHIEMSQQLMTGIKLFPPVEASYPTYVDFDAALRKLSHHKSRKRLRLQGRQLRKQDKYQLKTWDHYSGEA